MSFAINNEIKEKDIRKLELISQTDGHLQILRMNPDWANLLEKRAKTAEAVSSIGVEGTVISLVQAKAITEGKSDVVVGEKEKREFTGYLDSLEYIKEQVDKKLTTNLLLRMHEKITKGVLNPLF